MFSWGEALVVLSPQLFAQTVEEIEQSMGYDLSQEKEPIAQAIAYKNAREDDWGDVYPGPMPVLVNDVDNLFQTLRVD